MASAYIPEEERSRTLDEALDRFCQSIREKTGRDLAAAEPRMFRTNVSPETIEEVRSGLRRHIILDAAPGYRPDDVVRLESDFGGALDCRVGWVDFGPGSGLAAGNAAVTLIALEALAP